MSSVVQPTPAPNVELELAKLANDAMQNGADPHDTTQKLHQTIAYLRQFPKMAEQATNALADGVASPADITRTLWPHVSAMQHATGSNAPSDEEVPSGTSDSTLGAFGRSVAATGANLAQGIPGMEAGEAWARSGARTLAHKAGLPVEAQNYRDALSDIRGATGKIPTALRVGERMAGAVPLAAVLPGGAAASGAIVGGADQLLNADPDQSLAERGLRTVVGAAGGALVGKLTDAAVTGARSAFTQRPASLLLQKQAERAASAKDLYAAALTEGRGHEATPAIRSFLQDPQIADIVGSLQETASFANKPAESPEMLDAIYKTLSDQAKQAQRGLDALNPRAANQGRFRLADIKAKQQQLLRAMGAGGEKAPLTLDVAPETFESSPAFTAGREPLAGPVGSGTLASTTTPPNPTLSQGLRNFQGNTANAMAGPAGPAFQPGAQPETMVRPGVRIETPAMRVQTAPAQYQPAMMPTYQRAVEDYAKRSAEIQAIERGYDALRGGLSGNLPAAKNLTRKTPEAFAEWAAKAAPEEVAAARQGILGAAKMATKGSANPLQLFGLRPAVGTMNHASSLLRDAPTTPQAYLQLLQNLGLLTAGNTATSP